MASVSAPIFSRMSAVRSMIASSRAMDTESAVRRFASPLFICGTKVRKTLGSA
jgi:hypothetical protein